MSSATLATTPLATPGESAGSASNAFVINLVSSTTPVALIRPDHAGLRRFNFFVSRRREEGRERFRLHMGYFDTQEQAEQLLDIVRTIYPGAWAGLAPGRRLAAAAAAMAATPAPVASAAPVPTTATVVATAPKGAARVTPEGAPSALALVPDEGRRPLADVEDVPEAQPRAAVSRAATPRVETAQGVEQRAARNSLSNIRAAIASLEDSGIRSPLLDALPTLAPAVIPVAQPAAVAPAVRTARPARPAEPVDPTSTLSDTGTLRLLETGVARPPSAGAATAAPRPVAEPAPREAPREEKPCFAVQLVWSVQPIEMAQVPQLAIFSAYTLYGAEGNRDGRRWYGLRLGFFTDAVSAKQVAQYVRADFATVSVVPVSSRERDQALKATGVASAVSNAVVSGKDAATDKSGSGAKQPASDTVRSVRAVASETKPRATAKAGSRHPEFAFIEGTGPLAPKPGAASQASAKPGAAGSRMIGGRPTRGAPGKRAKVRKPGQIDARTVVKPKTLEETLEILGANQLQVDDDLGASINDSGVGHVRLQSGKARPSKLSRLIGRLSERMGS